MVELSGSIEGLKAMSLRFLITVLFLPFLQKHALSKTKRISKYYDNTIVNSFQPEYEWITLEKIRTRFYLEFNSISS